VLRRSHLSYIFGVVAIVMSIVGATVTGNPGVLLAAVGAVILVFLIKDSKGIAEIELGYKDAKTQWDKANAEWEKRAGAQIFIEKKITLSDLRRQWEDIPSRKAKLLESLKNNQRQLQLARYLDSFRIASAKIDGIGPGRTQTLESFGIETAFDATRNKVLTVPGFGPKMQQKLSEWRASLEARFRFEPSKGIDPGDIQKVEADVRAMKHDLEDRLNRNLAELRQANAHILAARQHMRAPLEKLHDDLMQAEADFKAVHKGRVY